MESRPVLLPNKNTAKALFSKGNEKNLPSAGDGLGCYCLSGNWCACFAFLGDIPKTLKRWKRSVW